MLKQIKYILNSYTDKELEDKGLWVDAEDEVNSLMIDETGNIILLTRSAEVKINGRIDKEGK